jgi:phytoene desaturase
VLLTGFASVTGKNTRRADSTFGEGVCFVNMSANLKVSVVGSGIAGLAAAVRMAVRGYEVDVFEANAYPGGKLSSFSQDDYRFDAGPSLFTMPQYIEELFALAQKPIEPYFSYRRLDITCQYFWDDGTQLTAYADADLFAREVQTKLGVEPSTLFQIMQDSRKKYDTCGQIFLEKSLHKPSTWMSWRVVKAMFRIPTLDLLSTMHKTNKRLAKHEKLVQLFDRFATYNGSNPYKTPGLMTIIPHFEQHFGAYLPNGGMVAITNAVYQLALDLGVRFHFNTRVNRIKIAENRAVGVETEAGFVPAQAVISNMDVFHVYDKLLPQVPKPTRVLKQERSSSALIFYWGIARSFDQLDLHNIFFSSDYAHEFSEMAAGRVGDDPTVYVNITSKFEENDAPKGHENWFVMVNVPYDQGQDWDAVIVRLRQCMITKLNAILKVDLAELITTEAVLDPRTIASRTLSHQGALYGTSSNHAFAAFLRHRNDSTKYPNLFFCGGSTHPGGGIPLCLLSARIADEVMHYEQ